MKRAEMHVQLKPGIFGVKVRLMPPQAEFPDKIKIIQLAAKEEAPLETLKEEVEVVEEAKAEAATTEKGEEEKEAEEKEGEGEKKEATE
jgi:small subunit ribosomal protein S3